MTTDQALKVIHEQLKARNWSIATAESLTAGLIASTLASQSGSSAYLRGGIVAYTLEVKVALLGVDREEAAACNCVSPQVALQMALGARSRFGTECIIAVTGYAEPHQGRAPHAYYAVICGMALKEGVIRGDTLGRNGMRDLVAQTTLAILAQMLVSP